MADWMLDAVSGSPPPTATPGAGAGGWGSVSEDEEEDDACFGHSDAAGSGGAAQVLVLDDLGTIGVPVSTCDGGGGGAEYAGGACLGTPRRDGAAASSPASPTRSLPPSTAAAADEASAAATLFPSAGVSSPGKASRAQLSRGLECSLSLRGVTADAIALHFAASPRGPLVPPGLATASQALFGAAEGTFVFQLQMAALPQEENGATPSTGAAVKGAAIDSSSRSLAAAYDVFPAAGGGTGVAYRELFCGAGSAFEATGLRPTRTYGFRLRAQFCAGQKARPKREGWGEWREERFTCDCAPPMAPAPLKLAEGGASARALRMVCSGLGRDGGSRVTCVRLEMQSGAAGMEETFYQSFPAVAPGVGATELTARGLNPRTAYRVRARAGNVKGEGPWSVAASLATVDEARAEMRVGAPSALWRKPRELGVAWAPPGGCAAGACVFELEMAEGAANSTGSAAPSVGRAASASSWRLLYRGRDLRFVASSLQPARAHLFRVRLAAPSAADAADVETDTSDAFAGSAAASAGSVSVAPLGGVASVGEWSETLWLATEAAPPAAPLPPAVMRRAPEGTEVRDT